MFSHATASRLDSGCVWLIPAHLTQVLAQGRAAGLLGAQERQEVRQFQTAADRQHARLSRIAARLMASAAVGNAVAAKAWLFERRPDGGRTLTAPGGHSFQIGIADTDCTIGISLGRKRAPGLDIESRVPPVLWPRLATRFFAPQEATALGQMQQSEACWLYCLLWTAKEALAKAMRAPVGEVLARSNLTGQQAQCPRALQHAGLRHGAWSICWHEYADELVALCTAQADGAPSLRHVHELELLDALQQAGDPFHCNHGGHSCRS